MSTQERRYFDLMQALVAIAVYDSDPWSIFLSALDAIERTEQEFGNEKPRHLRLIFSSAQRNNTEVLQ